eukprot:CAMPEP_0198291844 /NCGR_PEP_ID=MMETSP1449-20131203/9222_1 /TAXON_ID=420275 /ORGANISM="Attheya septentrionalis, Strain CCMP2084" /LENGTH=285 /DNA_ID=CAMNT_0043990527 /DNA_START=278 /DNA_END=1135 /DNA_ORIENTATION=-
MNHVFSGWSVWLEPEEKEGSLKEKMKSLQQTCGGTNHGVHSFVPHITLLYNVSPTHNVDDETELGPRSEESQRLRVEQLLHDSLERFKEKQTDEKVMHQVQRDCHASNKVLQNIVHPCCDDLTAVASAEQGETSNHNESTLYHVVKPMGIHVMDYPKEADGGKGFDCAIPLVVIRNMPWLQALQDAVRETFPPDERHASSHVEEKEKCNNSSEPQAVLFLPHLALVYAPSSEYTRLFIEENEKQKGRDHQINPILEPLQIQYLSVWSTSGTIDDWFRIMKIPLSK